MLEQRNKDVKTLLRSLIYGSQPFKYLELIHHLIIRMSLFWFSLSTKQKQNRRLILHAKEKVKYEYNYMK